MTIEKGAMLATEQGGTKHGMDCLTNG
jgi:hypothetical protein